MSWKTTLVLTLMVIGTYAKPLDRSINESINNVDYELSREKKSSLESFRQISDPTSATIPTEKVSAISSIEETTTQNSKIENTTKVGPFSWFFTPFAQKVQLTPQSFLQDRIVQLKEALNNLGLDVRENVKGKQLGNVNGLLHVADVNDSGFYTNRLEPAGFFGGNGWLANKGGILGGPGAILSTGSLLTDYPTPYRKK